MIKFEPARRGAGRAASTASLAGVARVTRLARMAAPAAVLAVWSATAWAHPGHADSGFVAGFAHPWAGWDHLLAMLAVGLWAVQGGASRSMLALPAAFAAAVAAGLALGWAGIGWAGNEAGILASLLVLGGLLLTRARPALPLAVAGVALGGLLHGLAHGLESPAAAGAPGFALGLLTATLLLHGLGMGLAALLLRWHRPDWLRLAGGAVGLSGLGGLIALAF